MAVSLLGEGTIEKTSLWRPKGGRSIALRISTAHDFRVISARTWPCASTKLKGFQSEDKLDNEINARFFFKEYCDPDFLIHEFKLHKVIYNISRFREKFKILFKKFFIIFWRTRL